MNHELTVHAVRVLTFLTYQAIPPAQHGSGILPLVTDVPAPGNSRKTTVESKPAFRSRMDLESEAKK
jgi:hypothetical protein